MRRVLRLPLEATEIEELAKRTAEVAGASDPVAAAQTLWKSKSKPRFTAIRKTLEKMAGARSRCMYCGDGLGTDIEHFYPKKHYPHQAFTWTNYLLACTYCNSNLKRDEFPVDSGEPLLLNPAEDHPIEHLLFHPHTGKYFPAPESRKGTESIRVFGLNDEASPRNLPKARRNAFLKLQVLIEEFDRATTDGATEHADLVKSVIADDPFPDLLQHLVQLCQLPATARPTGIRAGMPNLIARHGIDRW